MSPGEDNTIEFVRERAAHWVVRMSEGELSEAERAWLQRWLLEDPRNEVEFRAHGSIQSLAMNLPEASVQRLTALCPDVGTPAEKPVWRRRRVLAMAAGVMFAALAVGWLSFRGGADHVSYVTDAGEVRDVVFEDGSVVHMNTRTRLQWLGDSNDRRVRLIEGEALFDVVHDEARPFRVLLDNSEIQVLGTSFNLYRKKNGDTVVTVLEGHVRVRGRNQAWERELVGGQQLVYRSIGPISNVQQHEKVRDAVHWREGVLEMTGKPLAEVVEELNRYSDREILIRDPELAAEEYGGVLDIRDVRNALSQIQMANPESIVVSESNGVYTIDRRGSKQ
ncbi:MAG TPA: FecR family protein [Steroidobacteraceae bacterium]